MKTNNHGDLGGASAKVTHPQPAPLGRPVYEKDTLSQERTIYQYDFKGNLVGERVYNYDSYSYANQLYGINNTFDDNGNVIKNALKTHVGTLTTNYAFNAETGLPSTVTMYGGRSVAYNYNDEGTLTGRSLSTNTPVAESFNYDDEGLISTHTIAHGADNDVYSYTYDENGNITEIKKGDTVQQSYEYDALNQLVRENDRDTGKTVVYEYDNYGNIEKKTEYAYTVSDTLGEAVKTIEYDYAKASEDNPDEMVWKDQLVKYNDQDINYDEIGNPITYRGATMTWLGRQMMSYSIENEIDISYTYDSDGLRTSKTVNGVKHNYYYIDGQLRYERNGDSYEIYYTYDADGRPILATKRDLVAKKNYQYYLITNTRGDIIETRNGDGNVNARFVYDAWGKLIAVTDANGNALSQNSFAYQISLKYRGYVYDNETGLYYLQSRYYDPEVGRFINADDVDYIGLAGTVGSYNSFAYCENNPVNDSDPYGYLGQHWWNSVKWVARIINAAIILISAGKSYAGQKTLKLFLKNNKNKILHAIRGKLLKLIGYSAYWWVGPAIELALELFGTSIGELIAKAFDRYIDARLGYKQNNGYIFN